MLDGVLVGPILGHADRDMRVAGRWVGRGLLYVWACGSKREPVRSCTATRLRGCVATRLRSLVVRGCVSDCVGAWLRGCVAA